MKIETNNKEERLDFFKSLYESARCSYADTLDGFMRSMSQYRGSHEIDGSHEAATTIRNITYEIIESQVSSDIPMPKVDAACYSEKRDRNARSVERLCHAVRRRLGFETMNDIDERYTYIYGGSVWYVEWDSSYQSGNEIGGVRVHCLSPKNLIPQPNVYSVEDMEYCFLKFTTTRGALMRRFGVTDEDILLAECECEEAGGFSDGDTVTEIITFYRADNGEIGQYIFSGDLVLSDIPDYYKRKVRVCKKCGSLEEECECKNPKIESVNIDSETLKADILRSDGTKILSSSPVLTPQGELILHGSDFLLAPTEIPYYTPKSFPIVVRRNTSGEGQLVGQSDCEFVRPEQQAINKIESRILQKLLRAGITPIVPEDASITLNNSVFGQLIKMKPGETLAQYGKVDTTPDISQDIAEAERLYEHAKRTLGISDAYQGISYARNESGYARQLQISQASGRLESKKKMKHTAYAMLDRLIFEHYLAFADEPRELSYKDAYGRIHNAEFNRYDFVEYDIKSGRYFYDDTYVFSVDQNGGAEYQREALWERNLENLRSGSLGDPQSPATLLRYWQSQERAHYPHARENVEYFTDLVRGGIETEVNALGNP